MKRREHWIAAGLAMALGVSGTAFAQVNDDARLERRVISRQLLGFSAVPRLGIQTQPMPEALSAQLGLTHGVGLVVTHVAQGVDNGLKQHDVLHKLGDQVLTNADQLRKLLDAHEAGAQVTFTVIRGGKPIEVTVTLPQKPQLPQAGVAPARVRATFLGVATEPISPQVAAQLGLEGKGGIVTVGVIDDSPAARVGLQRHDIILKVDDQPVSHPDELRKLIRTKKAGDEVTLEILREGKPRTIKAKLEEREVVDAPAVIGPDQLMLMPPFNFGEGDPFEQHQRMLREMNEELARINERMRKMLEDGHGLMMLPDPFEKHFGNMPMDLRIEIPEGMVAGGVSVSTFADGEHVITLTRKGDQSTLEVKDTQGKVIFSGPWNTEEDKARLPKELRAKVDAMNKPLDLRFRMKEKPDAPRPDLMV